MKNSFALLVVGLLLLSGCSSPFSREGSATSEDGSQTQDGSVSDTDSNSDQTATLDSEKACEDSGGSFKNGTCTCPDDTYGNQNTPIYTFDEDTGYCVDPDGAPGGVLGVDGKGADL